MKRFLQLIGVTIIIGFSYYSGTAQIVRPVNDTTICVGESVILEAQTGSYMYNWSTGQLSSAISVSPAVTTTYNLRVFVPDTGTELISNGEFDLGNTGFYSEYIYCPDPVLSSASHSDNESLWMEGRYAVDSNPQAYHANFSPCSGHTGNSPDKMLIVNGAPDEDVVVWSQTITVNPNQYYAFSTWAANVHPTNPARLEFKIDGVLMGDYIEPSAGLTCNWEEFYSLWYSGTKTSIEISIVNKNLIRSGNDYALDGISFNPLVEVPDSRTVTVIEPAMIDAGSDITICGNETAGLSAAVSNQTGFLWSTSGDGTFSNPSNINSSYTPGSNDAATGSVILTATANSNSPCGAVSDFLTLNLNPVPVIGFGDNQASCGGGNVILDAGNAGSVYSWNTGETSQTIEVSTAGTYSVEVTNSFNCVETDTVYVGFYANLTIDLGPDRTVCSGNPVVLNAGISGATYLWSTGETTQEIIVYGDGNYSVTVTNSYGCNATDDINVTLVPPPVVDLGPDQVLNAGDVIRLDAGSHFFYIWDDGSRNRYLDVDKPGLYAVRVFDMNGCSAMDMVNITSAAGTVPDVTLNDTIICRDESVELYAGNDFLFNWDVDGLSSRVVVSPDSTTTYNLRVFYIDETLELVNNGDFTLGNIGFQSDYYYCSSTSSWSCRSRSSKYTVSSNTRAFGSDKSSCIGVTGNSPDNVMVVEGGSVNNTVWEQDINVDPDSYYVFALNITNLKNDSFDDFELVVNGVVIESFSTNSPCNWDKYQRLVYSDSSSSLNVQINNTSTTGVDNAFALDGISMYKLSEIPLDVTVEVIQHVVADAGSDLAICESGTASLSGVVSNESSFIWRSLGDGFFDNTGILNPTYTPGSADILNGFIDIELSAQPIVPCVNPALDTVRVDINSNLNLNLGSDKDICQGNTISLDAGYVGASYLWNTGETTQTITVSTSGNYSVVVADANGCSGTDDINITIHPNPIVDLGADQEECNGNNIMFDAGHPGSTYLWSTGETLQGILVTTSGNYSVVMTDANGCSATDDANATIHPNPTVNLGADQETCAGGTITFDAGNAGSTYLWNTGETTQTITVSASGNYSVTVTDANGCSATDDANATIHPNPTVNLGADQQTCSGGTITFDAGNVGVTYLWSTSETTQTITVSTSGNYSVVVTDANGCSATDDVNATIHANPTVNLGADQQTCAGGTITFDAGNAGSTYLWSTGETIQSITVSTSGNYSVTVTDANGCSATDDANATIHPNPTVNLGADRETCAGGTITFDAGNAGSTYLWSTGETTQTITVSTSGNYSVTVTDANGCSAADDANATIHPNPIVNLGADQQTCSGNTITLDAGNSGSTYLWSTGETTQSITVSTSGNYSVTVTDANGCSALDDANATIHANPTVNLGADQETCFGNSITFDAGNAGSTYLWNTGETTQTITVSASGNYSVVVTDANGCSALDDANATIHPNLTVNLGADQETCAGGTITFDAGNAGSTYLWSTGETTQTISVSTSGNYSVTVTDANGCSATDDANAIIHANPTINLGADQETCSGNNITFDAGNAGSTYLWNTGETTQTITVSASGNYSVVVTDANGCSALDDANATIHPNPTVNLGADQETCAGGTITFDAGNAGSTYLWSTGETTQAITVSTSRNYSVTVTDPNGCSATDDANATIHANPTVNLGADQETCAGGTITLDAGNAGSTYLWSTGESAQTITVSTSDNYSVTVTDANGCSATDDANATIHPNPTLDLGADQTHCDGDFVVLDAGTQIGSYLWSTGETTQTITVSDANNYFVDFTDANGCVATDSIAVNFYPAFDFNLSYSTNLVCYGDSTYIEGPVQTGYSYQWNKDGSQLVGETNYSIKAGDTGWYTLNIINENGCLGSDSVHVEIIHLPINSLPNQIDMCFGESVMLDIGDGESFLWNDGITTQTRLAYSSGVYSVEVRDLNGCIGYDSVNVVVHDLPIVDLGPDLFICAGEELIIEAPDGYHSEWIPGGQTKEIYVYEEGEFTLKATDDFGCVGNDEIRIFVHDNPNVYLGRDTTIAEGTTLLLDAGSGYVQYEWNNQESSQFLKVDRDGEYAVNVVDMNGCRGNGKVKVAVNPVPNINLGGNAGICQGTSLMLDPGHWERYQWSTGETTRTINVNQSGNYIVSVWDVYGIMGTDTLHVEVYPSPELSLAADTLSFYKGQTVTIDAGSGYSSYYWSTGSDWRSIEVEEPGDYSVQVMNDFGCVAQSAASVKLLQPKMVVPNVFTPNGKGPNEIFYPVFKGVVTDFELYIYSRWGEQVFELRKDVVSNNELKYDGWNGTYKGEEAEIGVYVWMIFYGGKERAHGTVTLFR
ncbi:T9SS type B sorting domain-containing protein [Labilibaculum euxinus]